MSPTYVLCPRVHRNSMQKHLVKVTRPAFKHTSNHCRQVEHQRCLAEANTWSYFLLVYYCKANVSKRRRLAWNKYKGAVISDIIWVEYIDIYPKRIYISPNMIFNLSYILKVDMHIYRKSKIPSWQSTLVKHTLMDEGDKASDKWCRCTWFTSIW